MVEQDQGTADQKIMMCTATGPEAGVPKLVSQRLGKFSMLIPAASLLFAFLIFPMYSIAAKCEVEARVKEVEIQNCDGERFMGIATEDGTLASPLPFDAIPLGIESFWSDLCQCYLWQVSGIAGAHTHVVRFLRTGVSGNLVMVPGGEFGSEIGKISRVSQTLGFNVELRDSDVSGKFKTLERYRFDGTKFVKLK